MNDLAKPDLKHGAPHSSIPEVGHRRRMQRKLKFQSTAVCAVVIIIATCRGLALDPSQPASSYLRKNFTLEDGLPANEVHAILQTQNGFLWLGTEAGLARFDGERFTPIDIGRGGAQQIPVRALLTTPEGDLWVGTDAGLADIPGAGLDHTLWVGTSGGLYRFDRGKFTSIIPHDLTSRIEESSDGPNAPFHAEPARAASRIVSWLAMCRVKTTKLEEVRW